MRKILVSFICLVVSTWFISLHSVEFRVMTSFVSRKIFNPYDFKVTNIKQFATISLKEKFSKIRQHKFKTVFYSWLVASNLHTVTMVTDLSIKLALLKKRDPKSKDVNYFFPVTRIMKKIFLNLGLAHNEKGNIVRDENGFIKFLLIDGSATASGISWVYTPTLYFLYNDLYKKLYVKFQS